MTADPDTGAYEDSVEKGDYSGHGDPTVLKHNSFSSLQAYGSALVDLPRRLRYRSVAVWTIEQETGDVKARSKEELKKSLHWFDLINFGVGAMVGAGIFVTTGQVRDAAGTQAGSLTGSLTGWLRFHSTQMRCPPPWLPSVSEDRLSCEQDCHCPT